MFRNFTNLYQHFKFAAASISLLVLLFSGAIIFTQNLPPPMLNLENSFCALLMNSFTKVGAHVNHWQQSY